MEATPNDAPANVITVLNDGSLVGRGIKKGDFRVFKVLKIIESIKQADPITLIH